jgi:N-acyl-D-aspartate/D-glutamate deacylase
MTWDLVVRGGRVVDGSGLPPFTADVAVKDGRIARVGRVDEPARQTLDATGAIVAPRVHRRAHALRRAARLGSDGVASVVARRHDRPLRQLRLHARAGAARGHELARADAVARRGHGGPGARRGLRWTGGSFGDFWRRVEGRIGVNAGGYVGHSAVRRFVMGDAASERRATRDEVAAMQDLVRAAMREGALGFSTSQLDIHVAHDGREVPSNHAAAEEVVALAGVLGEFGHGAVEIIPRSFVEGLNAADRDLPARHLRARRVARSRSRRSRRSSRVSRRLGGTPRLRARGVAGGRAHPPDVRDQHARRAT